MGQLNQLTGAEFRFATTLHQQLAQLVEGAKVASMLGGKTIFMVVGPEKEAEGRPFWPPPYGSMLQQAVTGYSAA
ncbi:hypothetical protein [Klebsiella pneumoniae]|uniref:hypothetical protein n=1 Tax=Klebsiella pneumoniae TaxID=573 RepID=UPI001E413D21|nr:hypothetical protein [Klebsiella pneumoniae]